MTPTPSGEDYRMGLRRLAMERTALETTWFDPAANLEVIQFETVQDARVILGGDAGGPDRETPSTRFCIDVDAKAFVREDNGFTRDVRIQLWITPTQIAEIVKGYFSDMLYNTSRVYRELLERILRKRWAVMTSSIYRRKDLGGKRVEPYHKTTRGL